MAQRFGESLELEENLNQKVDVTAPGSREESVAGGLSNESDPQSLAFMVVGLARSGTTLIQRLLSEIPGVWVPSETHFWRHAAALVDRFPPPFDEGAVFDSMRWFADLPSSASLDVSPEAVSSLIDDDVYLWGLFEALVRSLSPPEAPVLGEKTPDHARWSIQLMSSVPSLKVIGVIRDPREVFRSHQSVPWGIKEPWRFAEKWVEHARILDDLGVLFPDRVQVVRYEDLVETPGAARAAAAALIGVAHEAAPQPTGHSTVEGLFGEHESWKARALSPIRPTEELWPEAVSPEAIAAIQHRAAVEMERWSYIADQSTRVTAITPPQEAWVAMRSDSESVAATKLPVTAEQWEAWQHTDRQKARRWNDRAERLAEDHQILELKAKEAEAVQVTLEDWRDQARDLAKVSAELAERNQHVEAQLSDTDSKLTDMRQSAANWRSRAETLQLEKMRLHKNLRSEQVRRLEAKKARVEAVAKLRRVRGRRWWKLGGALGRWRRRPFRVDVLVTDIWRLATSREPLPPLPDTKAIQKEIKALKRPAVSGKQPLDAAEAAYSDGDYETALEMIDALADQIRNTPEALELEKNCHIRMGEVSKALGAVRATLLLAEDQTLRSQQRILEGRLRETHTGWLPSVQSNRPKGWKPAARSVLHILKESLPFFERGYTMRSHTTLLAQSMAGFVPTVVTSLGFPRMQGFAEFPKVEEIDGIAHHRLDLGSTYDLRRIPYDQILDDQASLIAAIASEVKPAVIQAGSGYRGYETALVGLAVARTFEIPMIYEIRSFLEQTWTGEIERSETGEYYERRYAQETRCLLDADFVVTIAEAMRGEIVARGVPEEKIAVVPNVVDVERFHPRSKNLELAAHYGLEGRPVLGYISNLGAREGIDNLIEAVSLLRKSGSDVAGLVVGDGPMKSELESLIRELGMRDHFVLTGHVPNEDIEDHYALIDLFVVPRVDDRAARLVTPLKPLEAMSMEIPVIASDLPALRELASPGDRGEVFESGSPQALAGVAKEVLDSAEMQKRLVSNAKAWILSERTIEANAARYTKIFERVIGGS